MFSQIINSIIFIPQSVGSAAVVLDCSTILIFPVIFVKADIYCSYMNTSLTVSTHI